MNTGELNYKGLFVASLIILSALFFIGASTEDGKLVTDVSTDIHYIEEHFHSAQKTYPDLADPVSIVSTNGVGTWTLGADTEIVPISTITEEYDLHHIVISSISANEDFQLNLYSGADGAGTLICSVSFSRVDAFTRSFDMPVMTDILPANTRVYGKLADGDDAGITVLIKVLYHTY